MAKLSLSEILKRTSEQPAEQQGLFLRTNWNPTLGQMIRYAFDDTYVWAIPEGSPPYTPNKHLDQESNLYAETRRMYIFFKGSGDHVPQKKKELNFIQLLENLEPADAELLLAAKDGGLPYGITMEFILRELPGQIVIPREAKTVEAPTEVTPEVPTFPEASASEPVVEQTETAPAVETTPTAPTKRTTRTSTKKAPVKKKKTVARKAKA